MAGFIRSLKEMRWSQGTLNREGYEKAKKSINRLIKFTEKYERFNEEYEALFALRKKIDEMFNEDFDNGTARFEDVE